MSVFIIVHILFIVNKINFSSISIPQLHSLIENGRVSPSACCRKWNFARSWITFTLGTKCTVSKSCLGSGCPSAGVGNSKLEKIFSASLPIAYTKLATCTSPVSLFSLVAIRNRRNLSRHSGHAADLVKSNDSGALNFGMLGKLSLTCVKVVSLYAPLVYTDTMYR